MKKTNNKWTDRRMDGWMNRTTDRYKPVYPSLAQSRGIKIHIPNMERKKIQQIRGRISMRLVCNPTIQYIIINLHTKYDYSCLHGFTEIFEEKFHYSKYGKEENWTNTWKNKQEKAGLQSDDKIHHY